MTDLSITAGAGRLAYLAPRLGFWLALLSVVLLALAPIGWRTGLWHFRTSFYYLMQPAAYLGIAAGVISLVSLLWWGSMGGSGRLMALTGFVIGALIFYVPFSYYRTLGSVPRIHDITTDTVNPPSFSATVLALRAAEQGASTAIDPKVIAAQQAGYPDLAPLTAALPPADAFARALDTAKGMAGWTIVDSDPATGIIEAHQSTRFFGFTDDMVIRVAAAGTGSRIDMRSESRQGISDFGVNAKRVHAYMTALQEKLGVAR